MEDGLLILSVVELGREMASGLVDLHDVVNNPNDEYDKKDECDEEEQKWFMFSIPVKCASR